MFRQLLAKSPARRSGERLYAAAAAHSRSPALYADLGVPDTVEGRFEILTLHVILLIDRLNRDDAGDSAVRQTLFDAYVSNLDGALREMGVGDLGVGKRMRKLGEAFYGRARAYEAAFLAFPDLQSLEDLIDRTVFEGASSATAPNLADYIRRCRHDLALGDISTLVAGDPAWASP